MNKKVIIAIIMLVILIGVGVWYFLFYNKNTEVATNEIIPEEEISEEQMRQTIVSLYFYNESTQSLVPEGRLIDVKELVENPYKKLMELLIEGPQNSNLVKTIPDGTKINSIELKGDTLYIDFSKEFMYKTYAVLDGGGVGSGTLPFVCAVGNLEPGAISAGIIRPGASQQDCYSMFSS